MQNNPLNIRFLFLFILLSAALISCRKDDLTSTVVEGEVDLTEYPDWTEATHGILSEPDYSIVFNDEDVLRIDIEISSDNWDAMQSDLESLIGYSGGGPGGPSADLSSNPIWVECSLKCNGLEWYHVGVRYKGNSSLSSTYSSGNRKLPFKVDFDEFEGDYPAITDQRFYGFKQLSLKNNYNDVALMREKVGADLFRAFGVASPHTAFCVLYIDNGSGSQYYGVYTLVEEVDDSMIGDQFSDGSGNLYKPDGDAAKFASGTYDEDEMELKTNTDAGDYSDVKALYDIINSSDRVSNNETWMSELEKVFNVDAYLKYLAANTTIQNWDTYGIMTHNYYLYNNPENEKLTWIPWDNNEAFQSRSQGGTLSLSLSEVSSSWPLISYIIDQPEYEAIYKGYLYDFTNEVFKPSEMITLYNTYYNLLKEYADAEESDCTFINYSGAFDNAVSTLNTHVQQRYDAVASYLQ